MKIAVGKTDECGVVGSVDRERCSDDNGGVQTAARCDKLHKRTSHNQLDKHSAESKETHCDAYGIKQENRKQKGITKGFVLKV